MSNSLISLLSLFDYMLFNNIGSHAFPLQKIKVHQVTFVYVYDMEQRLLILMAVSVNKSKISHEVYLSL